ncbi:hypothetical protein K505DRAFT_200210, partial [Melanomma pulvis-pyrius CBS 109.77]
SPSYPKYIPQLTYTEPPTRLQTLDLWLPRPLEESDPHTTVFIIYIHGGAWRDPAQDSTTIHATLAHLSAPSTYSTTATPAHPSLAHIAGVASLDYRLSPYKDHPTDPSAPDDESRNAKWPDHIHDVRAALRFLAAEYGVGRGGEAGYRWIGAGHSCGATLLAQHVSGIGLEEEEGKAEEKELAGPEALVLIAGIYSLPHLLSHHQPPRCPPAIADIYASFVRGAFGPNVEDFYTAVSPLAGAYTRAACPALRSVVLAYSPADELIEPGQRAGMLARLRECGWVERREGRGVEGERIVEAVDLTGGHDEVWEDGRQVAVLIGDAV